MNRVAYALLAVLLAGATPALAADPTDGDDGAPPADPTAAFAASVDLEPWSRIAVHYEGRLKSFESFARTVMQLVSGARRIDGQPHAFTVLDLALRPEDYVDRDVIFVKKKLMRAQIARALEEHGHAAHDDAFAARLARFGETGLISERLLLEPEVQDVLERLRADLLRQARHVEELDAARYFKDPDVLLELLAVVPPWAGTFEDPWTSLAQLESPAPAAGALPDERRVELLAAWTRLRTGWRARDAGAVNAASAELAEALPAINPDLYPSASRLAWESRYFRQGGLTWVWVVYLASVPALLLSIAGGWRGAGRFGLSLFGLAFALHTASVVWRTYVADRWPNTNMFEAVTTAAWFGGVLAVVLEIALRRSRLRQLFALGSAVASMLALMAAHYLPVALSPNIGNKMPVLHDVWLYIHTNVIIASYVAIFMAAVTALLYLVFRPFVGRADFMRFGGAGGVVDAAGAGNVSLLAACDGVTMVLMELSFVMLWAGIVMGAIWADHSWGRPWGWDPKEVFALNTFLVFAVLVHVRHRARDKGLWTALLALAGAGVMLFNWIVINFKISGLHSYA